jgi:ribosomal protein L37AE/L43A
MKEKNFILCEKCGKRLIERMENGLWHFVFGKSQQGCQYVPVEMYIHGNVKIKCLRRGCGHWNVLNFFPNT